MATPRVVEKYCLDDSTVIPYGTALTAALDVNSELAVWVEHAYPVDESRLMVLFTVLNDESFTRDGTYVGTAIVSGVETHVYNAGLITA